MAKIQIKTKEIDELIEVSYRYEYERGPNLEIGGNYSKNVQGAFFAKKGATDKEINAQIKKFVNERIKIKLAEETKKEVDIDLES